MSDKKFTVYVTNWALTSGIQECVAQKVANPNHVFITGGMGYGLCIKPDWHATREEAVARAELMRTKRIASLRKQIAKLEAMTF